MTKEIKTIVALIVLIVVVIVGWVWYGMSNNAPTQTPVVQSSAPVQENTYVPADAGLTTSASDSSDAALQSDLDSVNTQMNSLNTDTSSISQ